jgi:hypothetical protein
MGKHGAASQHSELIGTSPGSFYFLFLGCFLLKFVLGHSRRTEGVTKRGTEAGHIINSLGIALRKCAHCAKKDDPLFVVGMGIQH